MELPKDSKLAKLVGKISAVNLAVEQWPRLAEFMATVQKGNRTKEELMEAMYNAADITTNFGRSGQAGKFLNANVVPFLNPSIQGFDKLVRTLGKVLDANSKLNKLNERGITGDTLTEAQTIADQLNGENQALMDKSLTGSNGWKPTEGDRKFSILESMNLPEEEAFAIWKMKILDDDGRWNLKVMEEAGLPAIEYYRYKMAVKHLNGKEYPNDPGTTLRNSKQDQRLPVINSLNLTTKQKELLWFDNGWSEKTLWKAPWH